MGALRILAAKLAVHAVLCTGLGWYFAVFLRRLFPGESTYPQALPFQIKLRITCAFASFLLPPVHLAIAWGGSEPRVAEGLTLVYLPHFLFLILTIGSEVFYKAKIRQPKAQIFLPVVCNPTAFSLFGMRAEISMLQMPFEHSALAACVTATNIVLYSTNWLFNIMPLVPICLQGFGESACAEPYRVPGYLEGFGREAAFAKPLLDGSSK